MSRQSVKDAGAETGCPTMEWMISRAIGLSAHIAACWLGAGQFFEAETYIKTVTRLYVELKMLFELLLSFTIVGD